MSGQYPQIRYSVCDTEWIEAQYMDGTAFPGYLDAGEIQTALCKHQPETWMDRLMITSMSMEEINELSKKVVSKWKQIQ